MFISLGSWHVAVTQNVDQISCDLYLFASKMNLENREMRPLIGDLPKSNQDVRSRYNCLAGKYYGWQDVSSESDGISPTY